MSILYTITAYPPSVGGAQIHLHELARRIGQTYPVGVLYQWNQMRTDWLRGTTIDAPQSQGAAQIDGVPTYQISLSDDQRAVLRRWVTTYRLTQGTSIRHISSALQSQIECALPYVLKTPPLLIHNSRIGREGLTAASLAFARAHAIPFVLTPNHHHRWNTWIHRHYLRMYQQADAVIALTAIERDELIRLGVKPEKITVLGIGAVLAPHPDRMRFRAAYHIPPDAPLILFLGQKYRYKRYALLVKAMDTVWKTFPGAYVVLIGPRTASSARYFRAHRSPQLIELDTVTLQTKTDAIAACDVLCVPSSSESFGGVYLEAWTMGKPVIGGDAPAIRDVITDGVNGFIVANDPAQLARRLSTLIADPSMRAAFAQSGRDKAKRYQWDVLSAELIRVYRRLIGSGADSMTVS